MEIRQLKYLITIVECGCNLSLASKKLHLSQPALSKMIKGFEENEGVALFKRHYGRLEHLTYPGELFYQNALELVARYDEMMEELRKDSHLLRGKITIGIPPLILSTIFPQIIIDLILTHPTIKIELVEIGAFDLKKCFLLQELDIVVLLKPTMLDPVQIEEVLLMKSELAAFMDAGNPLNKMEQLSWQMLDGQPMAIFDKTFMTHHLLNNRFLEYGIEPKQIVSSGNWDFLWRSVFSTDLITVMPAPVSRYFTNPQVTMKSFDIPLDWEVVACRYKKRVYSRVEDYVFQRIIDYFKEHE